MNKLLLYSVVFSTVLTAVGSALAQQKYEVPPTETTRSHVPYISDDNMKKCVEIYNPTTIHS